ETQIHRIRTLGRDIEEGAPVFLLVDDGMSVGVRDLAARGRHDDLDAVLASEIFQDRAFEIDDELFNALGARLSGAPAHALPGGGGAGQGRGEGDVVEPAQPIMEAAAPSR